MIFIDRKYEHLCHSGQESVIFEMCHGITRLGKIRKIHLKWMYNAKKSTLLLTEMTKDENDTFKICICCPVDKEKDF
jgi:hypothetical protein